MEKEIYCNIEIMEETPQIDKRELGDVVEGVGKAEDLFFSRLEKEMQNFLRKPAGETHPEFEETRQEVLKQEEGLRNNPQTQDVIRVWEEDNEDYQLKYIKAEVEIENTSEKEISLEFVDFLLGNFLTQNTQPEMTFKLEEIAKIRVLRVSADNNGIIISIETKDKKIVGLVFVGAPEFNLKIVEFKKHIYSF